MSIDTTIPVIEKNTTPSRTILTQGENKMADVDTIQLSSEHADIRREAAMNTANILSESAKGFDRVNADVLKAGWANSDVTKDARYDLATRIEQATDRTTSQTDKQYHANENRQVEILRDIAKVQAAADLNRQVYLSGTESAMLKNQVESLKNTQFLAERIAAEGGETRALINDLKYNDLNRALIERNAALVEERGYGRHWRGNFDQSQWQALSNQLQAFQSQLATSTQGMVNFGTQAGVGQTSTSNNVR